MSASRPVARLRGVEVQSPGPAGRISRGRGIIAVAVAVLALAAAGAVMSAYLAVENLQGESGVCSGVAHGCATVQQSPYGKILGIPVSLIGLVGYLLLTGLAIVWLTNVRGAGSLAAFLGFNACLAALLFSAYLTYLEAFVIDAWCIYCISSAIVISLLSAGWAVVLRAEVQTARAGGASPNLPI